MPWQTPAGLRAARTARRPALRVAVPARPWPNGTPGISRWPITVPPVPGEQAQSWLSRVGYRYDLSPHQLLAALGARTSRIGASSAAEHVEKHRAAISTTLGLDGLPLGAAGDVVARALIAGLAGYRRTFRSESPRATALNGPRYCPACLDEGGGVWPEAWRSPLHLVCLQHRVLLERDCPACGRPPWSTSAWTTWARPSWACPELAPGAHTARTRHQQCRQDLRTTATRPATAAQAAVQEWVIGLAVAAATDPAGTLDVAGLPSTHADHLTAALDLLDEHAHGSIAVYDVAADPAAVLAGLSAAADVLTAVDPATAGAIADRHGVLDPAGPYTPVTANVHGPPRHELLVTLRLRSVAERLSPLGQLTFRTGRGRPRYPSSDRRPRHHAAPPPDHVPLAWIPQQLWPGVLVPHLAEDDYKARACAAMLLARLGAPRPWQLIAVDLGLPRSFASYPPAMVRRLRRTGAWPDFLGQLEDLADHLTATPPPIDYSERRWISTDVPLLQAALGATLPAATSTPRHIDLSIKFVRLLWEIYTGGDLRLAPAPLGLPEVQYPAHEEHRSEVDTVCDEWFAHAAEYLAVKSGISSTPPLW